MRRAALRWPNAAAAARRAGLGTVSPVCASGRRAARVRPARDGAPRLRSVGLRPGQRTGPRNARGPPRRASSVWVLGPPSERRGTRERRWALSAVPFGARGFPLTLASTARVEHRLAGRTHHAHMRYPTPWRSAHLMKRLTCEARAVDLAELAGHDGRLRRDRRDRRVPAGLGVGRAGSRSCGSSRSAGRSAGRLARPVGEVVGEVPPADHDRLRGAGRPDRVDQRLHADRGEGRAVEGIEERGRGRLCSRRFASTPRSGRTPACWRRRSARTAR